MSAFHVGHAHIDALLNFASGHDPVTVYFPDEGRLTFSTDNATDIGKTLLLENERSLEYRYPGETDHGDETAANYKFRLSIKTHSALVILKACDCFDYQSCETPDYGSSKAHRMIEAIRHRAIRSLPGYSDADGWEIKRDANEPEVILLSDLIKRRR